MTKLKLKNRRRESISYEETILDFFSRNPDKKPDGSFVMQMFLRGYREGQVDATKEGK